MKNLELEHRFNRKLSSSEQIVNDVYDEGTFVGRRYVAGDEDWFVPATGIAGRINQSSVKAVREQSPHNKLARATPIFRAYYKTGGDFYKLLGSHFNWEGRASGDLREMLAAGCFPDEGESEVGKTRRLY